MTSRAYDRFHGTCCLKANQLKVMENIFGQLRVLYPYFVALKSASDYVQGDAGRCREAAPRFGVFCPANLDGHL